MTVLKENILKFIDCMIVDDYKKAHTFLEHVVNDRIAEMIKKAHQVVEPFKAGTIEENKKATKKLKGKGKSIAAMMKGKKGKGAKAKKGKTILKEQIGTPTVNLLHALSDSDDINTLKGSAVSDNLHLADNESIFHKLFSKEDGGKFSIDKGFINVLADELITIAYKLSNDEQNPEAQGAVKSLIKLAGALKSLHTAHNGKDIGLETTPTETETIELDSSI